MKKTFMEALIKCVDCMFIVCGKEERETKKDSGENC